MKQIKDESTSRLIYWLDMARRHTMLVKDDEIKEIDALIAELENADPVPTPLEKFCTPLKNNTH